MAIALTQQPTSGELLSGYLPIEFVATETTNNPEYLVFTIKTAAGATIAGVPAYKAPNINNEYKFNASAIIQSLFNIHSATLTLTDVEDLTEKYKNLRVDVSDPINSLTTLASNTFFAFSFLEDANDAIVNKQLLYANNVIGKQFPSKWIGKYDAVTWWTGTSPNAIQVTTYESGTPKQVFYWHNVGNTNKLMRVPLNTSSFIANFSSSPVPSSPVPIFIVQRFDSFKVEYPSGVDNFIFYKKPIFCKTKEFLFINKYGISENVIFETKENLNINTKGEVFKGIELAKFKVNQTHDEKVDVRGQRFKITERELLSDFIKSPAHATDNGVLNIILLLDGSYKIISESRGVDFNFSYTLATKQLAFK
jgi:RNase P/RNase MRP subunit p29